MVNFCHFSISFQVLLVSRGLGDPPGIHFSSTAEKGMKQIRFLTVLGSLLETLGAPFGDLFGPCGHPEGPRTEKTTHCKVSVRGLDF